MQNSSERAAPLKRCGIIATSWIFIDLGEEIVWEGNGAAPLHPILYGQFGFQRGVPSGAVVEEEPDPVQRS
jgi:hypothetical protein